MSYRRAGDWFAPKRYSYGSGLPISWEGWLVLAAFITGISAAVTLVHGPAEILAVAGLVALSVIVVALKTRGGWRWRWGDND